MFSFWASTPQNQQKLREKVSANFFSSTDGPIKSTEIRQGWNHARRLPNDRTIAEKRQEHYLSSAVCECARISTARGLLSPPVTLGFYALVFQPTGTALNFIPHILE